MADWKKDESGNVVLENGNPVWVDDAGEYPVVGKGIREKNDKIASLSRDNAELKAKNAEYAKVTALFEGVEDLPAFLDEARKNAETVAGLGDKDKDVEEAIRRRTDEAVKSAQSKYEAMLAKEKERAETALMEATTLKNTIREGVKKDAFMRSSFVREKCAWEAELMYANFGNKFIVTDDNEVLPCGADGSPVYGVDFEQGIEQAVGSFPYKATVLKSAPGGSGTRPGSGPAGEDRSKMSSTERIAAGLKAKGA